MMTNYVGALVDVLARIAKVRSVFASLFASELKRRLLQTNYTENIIFTLREFMFFLLVTLLNY